ncbi:hypothetical protein [Oceanithermus sp.]
MKRKLALLLLVLLLAPAAAQTLLEVQTATAISLKYDPQVRLPRGSFRALGPGVDRWLAKLRGADGYGHWEAYVAQGVARRLRDVYVGQVATGFAQAGYLLVERKDFSAGNEKHRRYVFEGPAGQRAMLYVIEAPDALVWLVGWSE